MPLRRSSQGDAEIVAWENKRGKIHVVKNTEGGKVGRAPSDRTVERANRVVIHYKDRWYTAYGINPDYDLDAVIEDIESDRYQELIS